MDLGAVNPEAADINPVEPEHRPGGRETAHRNAVAMAEHFVQAEALGQMIAGYPLPAVVYFGFGSLFLIGYLFKAIKK